MDIIIAHRLVALRKKHGYSQEGLAEKLGISRQAISKWERAESSPDTDNLIALSKLYEISLDALLHGNEDGVGNKINSDQMGAASEKAPPRKNVPVQVKRKKASRWYSFPYPLLVVLVYCLLGVTTGEWGSYWFLFLSIPLYYLTVNYLDCRERKPCRRKKPPLP